MIPYLLGLVYFKKVGFNKLSLGPTTKINIGFFKIIEFKALNYNRLNSFLKK